MAGEFAPGDPVTPAWYRPGERHRPRGSVVRPTRQDIDRLNGIDAGRLVLVHWHTGGWRRWECVEDLRRDDPTIDPGDPAEATG